MGRLGNIIAFQSERKHRDTETETQGTVLCVDAKDRQKTGDGPLVSLKANKYNERPGEISGVFFANRSRRSLVSDSFYNLKKF